MNASMQKLANSQEEMRAQIDVLRNHFVRSNDNNNSKYEN
jgi:hypothetical protein